MNAVKSYAGVEKYLAAASLLGNAIQGFYRVHRRLSADSKPFSLRQPDQSAASWVMSRM
jgi:hypothetical protein